jgi:hypothetical protein
MAEKKAAPVSPKSGKVSTVPPKQESPKISASGKGPASNQGKIATSPRNSPAKVPSITQPPKSPPPPPKDDDSGWDDEEQTSKSPKVQYEVAEVIADYIPEKPQEHLTLLKYDRVYVMKKGSDGWWEGECNGVYGKFPAKHVKLLKEKMNQEKKKGANVW